MPDGSARRCTWGHAPLTLNVRIQVTFIGSRPVLARSDVSICRATTADVDEGSPRTLRASIEAGGGSVGDSA
jgi:hypothetical protein